MAVKGNQERLAKAVRAAFSSHRQAGVDMDQWQTEKHHGRVESRTCHVLSAEQMEGNFSSWTELSSIVMVENFQAEKGKKPILEYRDYISSKALTAEEACQAIRAHWGMEAMHWILDVTFGKDACQIYRENAAENVACLRHRSLNMLRAESTQISMPMEQKRCTMNPLFLESVLVGWICINGQLTHIHAKTLSHICICFIVT